MFYLDLLSPQSLLIREVGHTVPGLGFLEFSNSNHSVLSIDLLYTNGEIRKGGFELISTSSESFQKLDLEIQVRHVCLQQNNFRYEYHGTSHILYLAAASFC